MMQTIVQISIKCHGRFQLFKSSNPRFADGEQMRDFIYVNDAVDITLSFFESNSASGLFNCGTGKVRTWNDLVIAVFQAMNQPVAIEYIEMPEAFRGKYQYFAEARMEKLRAASYMMPLSSLEDCISDHVTSYLNLQEEG